MRRNIRVALGENARDLGTLRFDAQGAREPVCIAGSWRDRSGAQM
jgi:hypothetical protein